MKIKRGSVTPVDLTGQADGDYIRNDGGIYKPKTPSEVIQNLIETDQWEVIGARFFTFTANTGSGAILSTIHRYLSIRTGTTTNSTSRVAIDRNAGWSSGMAIAEIDWRKNIVLRFRASLNQTAVEEHLKRWVYWGSDCADAIDDPTSQGIGIRTIDSGEGAGNIPKVQGIVHDGTTLTAVDLVSAGWGFTLRDFTIHSHGDGNVDFYYNGVLTAQTAAGPASIGSTNKSSIRACVHNGAGTEEARLVIYDLRVYVEQ